MISSDNKSKDKDKSVVQDKVRLVQDRDMHIKETNRDFSGDTSNRKNNEDFLKKTVSDVYMHCNQPKKPLSCHQESCTHPYTLSSFKLLVSLGFATFHWLDLRQTEDYT